MGREEIEFLVRNNLSFYETYMPKAWRQRIAVGLSPHASRIELSDDLLILFVDAVSEEIPWFAEVVTREKRAWLINELELAFKDVEAYRAK